MTNKSTYQELEQRVRDLAKVESRCKQAEEALIEREQFLSRIINENPFPIWIGDSKGTLLQCNQALLDLLQLEEHHLVGKYNILEDPLIEHLREGVRNIFDKGETWTFEVQWEAQPSVGFDSSQIFIAGGVFPIFNPKGKIVNIVAVYHDITKLKHAEEGLAKHRDHLEELVQQRTVELQQEIAERKKAEDALKESEAKFRQIYEHMSIGVAKISLEFRIENANDAYCLMLGYSENELLRKHLKDITHPETLDENLKKQSQLAKGDIDHFRMEKRFIHKNGRIIHGILDANLICDTNGKPLYFLDSVLDITEQKKMDEQLRQIQKMEAIGTLAGGIAHDFNNMLGVITGNISYALSSVNQNEEIYEVLLDVSQGAMQAQNLTHQLITFAKGGEPVKKIAKIKQIIEESTQFVLRGSDVQCTYLIPNNLWLVDVDSGQINQVFTNLTLNAIQAMPEGGVIQIQAENSVVDQSNKILLQSGKYVKIHVIDQGIGVSEKHLSKIFDPYFSTKQKGKGLGLSTTLSIITKHGGHIFAESQLDIGTTICIYLPVSVASAEQVGEIENQKQASHKGQGKILVMDDQEPILKMLGRLLNRMGYETAFATDGSQAIDLYRDAYLTQEPFDAVILDLTVPGGLGGAKTIPELLKIDPKVKAIVSSGYSNDPIMANYEDYGFYGVVPKPYTKEQVSEVLNKILGENG